MKAVGHMMDNTGPKAVVEWITVILSDTIMVGNLMNNTGPRSHVGIIM